MVAIFKDNEGRQVTYNNIYKISIDRVEKFHELHDILANDMLPSDRVYYIEFQDGSASTLSLYNWSMMIL